MKPIDPELLRRMEALKADGDDLGAVITVQDLSSGAKPLAPTETESIVRGLMDRVEEATGLKPSHLRVQKNLGTFLVRAKAGFM